LSKYKINTAWDFIKLPDNWVKKHMTVVGLRTKHELMGKPCIEIEEAPPAKKAICTSRSFGHFQTELSQLEEAVSTFAGSCSEKLRRQNSCATIVMIFIHTNQFKYDEPQYAKNVVAQLPVPTNSSMEIIKYARAALRKIYKPGYKYKKAGDIVSGIVPDIGIQNAFFDEVDRIKHDSAMRSMDKINSIYGINTLRVAAQGTARKWRLKQEKLSPQYTTNWDSIITIKL
jgi:DNA polymerase V